MHNSCSVVSRRVADLRPCVRNARTHSKRQISQIAESIKRFGFTNPILISGNRDVVAGHGRLEAAKLLGFQEVPTLELAHLSRAELRAYALADNKLALNAGWDTETLATELQALIDLNVDIEVTGFSVTEVDMIIHTACEADPASPPCREDVIPDGYPTAVTQRGDIWHLGRHLLLCGDALLSEDVAALMGSTSATILFTDPPYNVPINGHVNGLGRTRHREFAMASGEMSANEFTTFLTNALGNGATHCVDGAIAFVCMDWRHVSELLAAGDCVFSELKNICVWNKTNGGMGTFYRSKHEFVFVFKKGTAPHINNFGLGDTGRYRTNVWDYPGVSSIGSFRDEALEMHPTVKPVAMVADAIRDCSKRGHLVLDPFAGSGTTAIAAEICGRSARLIELDPIYCDTIVRRFENYTGRSATLKGTSQTFEDVTKTRCGGEVS